MWGESLVVPMEQEGKVCDPPQPTGSYFLLAATISHAAAGREKPGITPSRTAAGLDFMPGGCQLATSRMSSAALTENDHGLLER